MFKFIHTADAHIDSPLVGLTGREDAPADILRGATRDAFKNLIALALEEKVAFVVIAGDLFDGPWRDMQTGLWTAAQFRRLQNKGIRVFLIRGNHDAQSRVARAISWPENVRELSSSKPDTVLLEDISVAIHGRGFERQEALEDLTLTYPPPVAGCFNIGVLHTSLEGVDGHDTYAPTTKARLIGFGYDYWALGHVHARNCVHDAPHIAFPGNTQGRHINETGEKGCLIATVDDGRLVDTEFHATDVVRWRRIVVRLETDDDLTDLYARARDAFEQCIESSDGRYCAVRLTARGACAAYGATVARREEVVAELCNIAAETSDRIWLERLELETRPAVDLEALRRGQDLMGDLLRSIEQTAADDLALLRLAGTLEPLVKIAGHEMRGELDVANPETIRRWLRQAESYIAARLGERVS